MYIEAKRVLVDKLFCIINSLLDKVIHLLFNFCNRACVSWLLDVHSRHTTFPLLNVDS